MFCGVTFLFAKNLILHKFLSDFLGFNMKKIQESINAYSFLDKLELNNFVTKDYYDVDLKDYVKITSCIRSIISDLRSCFLNEFPNIDLICCLDNFQGEMPDFVQSILTSQDNLKILLDHAFYLGKLEIYNSIQQSSLESYNDD